MEDDHRRDLLTVPARFMGPPGSANGGYLSGLLASRAGLDGDARAVEVTLRRPPPLDTPLRVARDALVPGVRLLHDDVLVAEARPATLELDVVDPVPFEVAKDAETRYAGAVGHPFPTCFVCGTARSVPDGLGLRPGPVGEPGGLTACTWVPDATLAADGLDVLTEAPAEIPAELVWAALDCPGGWTLDIVGRPAVLGRITAQVDALPRVGEPCVVMGRLLRRSGRKGISATTAYDSDGRVLGRAESVWIEIDPEKS